MYDYFKAKHQSIFALITIFSFCRSEPNNIIVNAIPQATNGVATLNFQIIKNRMQTHLTSSSLQKLRNTFQIKTFIETGTWLGYTSCEASKVFDHVYTVEILEKRYNEAQIVLGSKKNVLQYLGNSPDFLNHILPTIETPVLLWLDAHWKTTDNSEATAILGELDALKKAYLKNAIIMIDDIRDFLKDSDYPSTSQIFEKILSIDGSYKIILMGDILLAYPSSYTVTISPLVRACTLMRLFYEDQSLPIDRIQEEKIIAEAQGNEYKTLQSLSKDLKQFSKSDLGYSTYVYWYSLALKQRGNNAEAQKQLASLKHFKIFQDT